MDTSSRSNISIKERKLNNLIVKWIGKGSRSMEVLEKLLQNIAIDMPVSLVNPDYEYHYNFETNRTKEIAFELINNVDDRLEVVLSFFDYGPNGIERTKRLIIGINDHFNYYKYNSSLESLELECTEVVENDGDLHHFKYSDVSFVEITLPFELGKNTIDLYMVSICIEPTGDEDHSTKFLEAAKKYVSQLKSYCSAKDIFEMVLRIITFNRDELNLIPYIEILVAKQAVDILSKICVEYGKITDMII